MLETKQSQNIQNIRWSHKIYRENHENLEGGIESLVETKIQRDIFQRDALSPLLFIIAMMSLNRRLRRYTAY